MGWQQNASQLLRLLKRDSCVFNVRRIATTQGTPSNPEKSAHAHLDETMTFALELTPEALCITSYVQHFQRHSGRHRGSHCPPRLKPVGRRVACWGFNGLGEGIGEGLRKLIGVDSGQEGTEGSSTLNGGNEDKDAIELIRRRIRTKKHAENGAEVPLKPQDDDSAWQEWLGEFAACVCMGRGLQCMPPGRDCQGTNYSRECMLHTPSHHQHMHL